jgi:polysaccharide biosynthesis protein PelC
MTPSPDKKAPDMKRAPSPAPRRPFRIPAKGSIAIPRCIQRGHAAALLLGAMLVLGCGTVTRIHAPTSLAGKARWVILPIANLAETVQAGERVEAMLDTVLRRRGITTLDRYPAIKEDDVHVLLSDRARYDASLGWARGQHYDYAVTGTVEEWRYKAGNESEPAVGLTLTVIDMSDNRTLWSGTGARVGSSFENSSGVALVLLTKLVEGMTLR